MKISIITVGKIKESYLRDAITEYGSILKKKVELFLIEVPDEKAPENLSEKLMIQVKNSEGLNILKHIKDDMFVITLEILGKEINQEQLVKKIKQAKNMNKEHICFVIGGSLGLSELVSKRSNFKYSFSKNDLSSSSDESYVTESIIYSRLYKFINTMYNRFKYYVYK